MPRIGIILGSARPHRVSPAIGQWALSHLASGSANTYEIIDLREPTSQNTYRLCGQ